MAIMRAEGWLRMKRTTIFRNLQQMLLTSYKTRP